MGTRSESWTSNALGGGTYAGNGIAGSDGSWNKQRMETTYKYSASGNEKGKQEFQSGRGTVLSFDGFDNYTAGKIEQTYVKTTLSSGAIQFKLMSSESKTWSSKVAGAGSWAFVNGDWTFNAASGGGTYDDPIQNSDGSTSRQIMTNHYQYAAGGKLEAQYGEGDSFSSDGFGNFTAGKNIQRYEQKGTQFKVAEARNFSWSTDSNGESADVPAVVWNEASKNFNNIVWNIESQTSEGNLDDSWNRQDVTTTYQYTALGKLIGQNGSGNTFSNDGFENKTVGRLTQDYIFINGQAKLSRSETRSLTENADGSWNSLGWTLADAQATALDRSRTVGINSERIGGKAMVVAYQYNVAGKRAEIARGKVEPTVVETRRIGLSEETRALEETLAGGEFVSRAIPIEGVEYTILQGEGGLTATYLADGVLHTALVDLSGEQGNATLTLLRDDGVGISITLDRENDQLIESIQEVTEDSSIVITSLYDEVGRLVGAHGSGQSYSNDGFDNLTISNIDQNYIIMGNQAKLKESISRSFTKNTDGSWSVIGMSRRDVEALGIANEDILGSVPADASKNSAMTVTYRYYGERDAGGNLAVDKDNQPLAVDAGQKRYFGSVGYAFGSGKSYSNDGAGNATYSAIEQTYFIINGQAKIETSKTMSRTENVDGSLSWQDGTTHNGIQTIASEITYTYDLTTGKLNGNGATAVDAVSAADDGFGNWTKSVTHQDYILLNGQAKLKVSRTTSDSATTADGKNTDGSYSRQVMTMVYRYYGEKDKDENPIPALVPSGDSKIGQTASVEGKGVSKSDDGLGNVTSGKIEQTYGLIHGQAKIFQSNSKSWSSNDDGPGEWSLSESYDWVYTGTANGGNFASPSKYSDDSWSKQNVDTFYAYNDDGALVISGGTKGGDGADYRTFGSGYTRSDDGFGNLTSGRIEQTFELVNGQAKLKESKSATDAARVLDGTTLDANSELAVVLENSDGSTSHQEIKTIYEYRRSGVHKGQQIGQVGRGFSRSNDGFNNYTAGSIEQIYELKTASNNSQQFKLMKSINRSWSSASNGGGDWSDDGLFTSYAGTGSYDDPKGGSDSSWSKQELITMYEYDASNWKQIGQSGYGVTLSNDGFNNYTVGTVKQEYVPKNLTNNGKIGKQFKVSQSVSRTWTGTSSSVSGWNTDRTAAWLDTQWNSLTTPPSDGEKNSDGSWNKQEMVTQYKYKDN
ncbi:MAG: hypothetical protein HYT97_05950, partial [Elusimicrobia bacterium]|nr:hypothetical protein [Elusimicrobiota bacterium]